MSASFKTSLVISGLFFYQIMCPASTLANEARSQQACDGNDCTMTLNNIHDTAALCSTSEPVAFWNRTRPEKYLVQCSCDCSMQTNTNWLIDKTTGKIYGFSAGRFASKAFISNSSADTEISDRFANFKFCTPPRKDALNSAIFVLLHKRPDSEASSYCYEITYIEKNGDSAALIGDHGSISKNDPNYWLKNIPTHTKSILFRIGKYIN